MVSVVLTILYFLYGNENKGTDVNTTNKPTIANTNNSAPINEKQQPTEQPADNNTITNQDNANNREISKPQHKVNGNGKRKKANYD